MPHSFLVGKPGETFIQHAENNARPSAFITGGTGYIGSRLIKKLLLNNYHVIALVRKGSEHKVPEGAEVRTGNPLVAAGFVRYIPAGATFIQLLGVAHPSPKKAKLFYDIDLKSLKASADAAAEAQVSHFIYMSVSMSPSRMMRAYQDVRRQGEQYCLNKNIPSTFIRPWYVMGPGHWWPILLIPFYGIAELVPAWRQMARAKALVTINQVLKTVLEAASQKSCHKAVLEIKDIRQH